MIPWRHAIDLGWMLLYDGYILGMEFVRASIPVELTLISGRGSQVEHASRERKYEEYDGYELW